MNSDALQGKRLGVSLTFDKRSGIPFQWVGVIDPVADPIEQKRHDNSQPDYRQLYKYRCSRSQDESQGGRQQSTPKCGKELQVGHPPNPGHVLNVPKDRRFLHGRLMSENLPRRVY